MLDREITLLNAIINYLSEHVKQSTESWSFKGLESDGLNTTDLLRLIYYVDPDVFKSLKKYALEKEEGE